MVEGICFLAGLITHISLQRQSFQIQFTFIKYLLCARYLGRVSLHMVYYINIQYFAMG